MQVAPAAGFDPVRPGTEPALPPSPVAPLGRMGVAATAAGNALEFYDFVTYSFFAVYIGHAFFPAGNDFASLLLSLATFGIGFFTRPLGGILIGAFADHAGRRPALMLTIGLMTAGTAAVALTPSYQTIGIAAPLILVAGRLLQGLALGGEVGPATAVLLEAAPPGRRAAYTAWQGGSQGVSIFLAGVAGLAVSSLLTREQLADWGWRIPFALGLLILPVGLYIRRRLPETLLAPHSRPGTEVLRVLLRDHWRPVALMTLVVASMTIGTYVGAYLTTYALTTLGLPAQVAMLAPLVQGVVGVGLAVWAGHLPDRYGRRRVMFVSRLVSMLAILPCFMLLVNVRSAVVFIFVNAVLQLLSGPATLAAQTTMCEIFPNAVRSAGMSVAYAVVVTLFGGTTQFVIAWLIKATGDPLAPAYYWIAFCVVSLVAIVRLPETRDLDH